MCLYKKNARSLDFHHRSSLQSEWIQQISVVLLYLHSHEYEMKEKSWFCSSQQTGKQLWIPSSLFILQFSIKLVTMFQWLNNKIRHMETSVLAKLKYFRSLLNHLRWSVAICEISFCKMNLANSLHRWKNNWNGWGINEFHNSMTLVETVRSLNFWPYL